MYLWGNINPLQALAVLDSVPLIDSLMVAQVGGQLQNQGLAALLLGPALGIPYKIYAVQAGALALPFFIFLCTTLPARLMRFILVCALANVMSRLLPKAWSKDARYQSLSLIWVLFYAIYALSHQ